MKAIIYPLYLVSVFLIAVALLGGSFSKTLIDGYSMKTIKAIGIDKENIDSMDVLVDNSIYNMNLMMYKIEKFKNALTFRNDDSKPPEFQHYKYIYNSVYVPILTSVSFALRLFIAFAGILIFIVTAFAHTIYSYLSLIERVRVLELRLNNMNRG